MLRAKQFEKLCLEISYFSVECPTHPLCYMNVKIQGMKKILLNLSSASITSTLKSATSFFDFSDLSGLDFVKFVHPGNIVKPQITLDKLSHDEKFLLLKAEKEENEYYSELQMTTLMNSRYD